MLRRDEFPDAEVVASTLEAYHAAFRDALPTLYDKLPVVEGKCDCTACTSLQQLVQQLQ